jgi:hypothetical protein
MWSPAAQKRRSILIICRWVYWLNAITVGTSLVLFFVCYFPPDFDQLSQGTSKKDQLKNIDVVGFLLYGGGLVCLLLALSMIYSLDMQTRACLTCEFAAWGGRQYTWGSAQVVATLVIGIVVLVSFVLYGRPRFLGTVYLVIKLIQIGRNIHGAAIPASSHESIQNHQLQRSCHCGICWPNVFLCAECHMATASHKPLHH